MGGQLELSDQVGNMLSGRCWCGRRVTTVASVSVDGVAFEEWACGPDHLRAAARVAASSSAALSDEADVSSTGGVSAGDAGRVGGRVVAGVTRFVVVARRFRDAVMWARANRVPADRWRWAVDDAGLLPVQLDGSWVIVLGPGAFDGPLGDRRRDAVARLQRQGVEVVDRRTVGW